MFLSKSIKSVKSGRRVAVPFCEDCNSQDIEIVKMCRNCGSHNVSLDLLDDRGQKDEYVHKTIYRYKCDGCGEEFDEIDDNKHIISFENGFFIGKNEYSSFEYIVPGDYCYECLNRIKDKLNQELYTLSTSTHIEQTMKELFGSDVK